MNYDLTWGEVIMMFCIYVVLGTVLIVGMRIDKKRLSFLKKDRRDEDAP